MIKVTKNAENAFKELVKEQEAIPVFQIMVMGFG